MVIEEEKALTVQPSGGGEVTAMQELTFEQLTSRVEKIQKAIGTVLKEDKGDFGIIPGTDKPTLLKPGAEKLAMLFMFAAEYQDTEKYEGDHLTVNTVCRLIHIPTQRFVGEGVGKCSTKESKYASRMARLKCPSCKKETIIKPKKKGNRPQSWWCNSYNGGCGNNYELDDPAIVNQERGSVANDKLPDQWNTVIKMAHKRAKVDAVLGATGASQFLTQDLEDTATSTETTGERVDEDGHSGDGNGTQSDGEKKRRGRPPGSSKAAASTGSAAATDKISEDQVKEFNDTCVELGYDPEQVLQSYQQFDPNIKSAADLSVGQFKNFQQKAEARRRQQAAG